MYIWPNSAVSCLNPNQQKMHIPSHVLEGMTPGHMEETFERAARMGVDPKQLFVKLVSHPELLKKLQEPQILAAFMDLSRYCSNGSNGSNGYPMHRKQGERGICRHFFVILPLNPSFLCVHVHLLGTPRMSTSIGTTARPWM